DEGVVAHTLHWWPLAPADAHARLYRLATDEALDISAELRQPLRTRARRVFLKRRVDDRLRHRWVHRAGVALPHEHRITVLAVVLPVGIPQRTTSRVR